MDINIKDAIMYEALGQTSNRSFFFTVYSRQSELALNKTGHQGCFLLTERFLSSQHVYVDLTSDVWRSEAVKSICGDFKLNR